MSEQKPVAWMSVNDIQTTYHGIELCANLNSESKPIQLFTADQLKAEREKAIRECAELFKYSAKELILSLLSTDESKA